MRGVKAVAWPLAIGAIGTMFFYMAGWSDAERHKAEASIAVACLQSGGKYDLTWNNKPRCTKP